MQQSVPFETKLNIPAETSPVLGADTGCVRSRAQLGLKIVAGVGYLHGPCPVHLYRQPMCHPTTLILCTYCCPIFMY